MIISEGKKAIYDVIELMVNEGRMMTADEIAKKLKTQSTAVIYPRVSELGLSEPLKDVFVKDTSGQRFTYGIKRNGRTAEELYQLFYNDPNRRSRSIFRCKKETQSELPEPRQQRTERKPLTTVGEVKSALSKVLTAHSTFKLVGTFVIGQSLKGRIDISID